MSELSGLHFTIGSIMTVLVYQFTQVIWSGEWDNVLVYQFTREIWSRGGGGGGGGNVLF